MICLYLNSVYSNTQLLPHIFFFGLLFYISLHLAIALFYSLYQRIIVNCLYLKYWSIDKLNYFYTQVLVLYYIQYMFTYIRYCKDFVFDYVSNVSEYASIIYDMPNIHTLNTLIHLLSLPELCSICLREPPTYRSLLIYLTTILVL